MKKAIKIILSIFGVFIFVFIVAFVSFWIIDDYGSSIGHVSRSDNWSGSNTNTSSISTTETLKPKLVKLSHSRESYSDYTNIYITVENPMDCEISYIEIVLLFYDENGNVIDSDWTNESKIPANSQKVIETMCKIPEGCKNYIAKIRTYY